MIVPPKACIPQTVIEQGVELKFEFRLFGRAVKYFLPVISALEQIDRFGLGARRYRFELKGIIHSQTQRMVWYRGQYYKEAVTAAVLPNYELQNVTGAVIVLCTPLRIRHGGRLMQTLSFQTLIRYITKRIEAITERYGGWIDKEEAGRVLSLAENIQAVNEAFKVTQMERYSNRINRKMDFSGLSGRIEYKGELSPFVPWLYAAQSLHIGRNTTFGMGNTGLFYLSWKNGRGWKTVLL